MAAQSYHRRGHFEARPCTSQESSHAEQSISDKPTRARGYFARANERPHDHLCGTITSYEPGRGAHRVKSTIRANGRPPTEGQLGEARGVTLCELQSHVMTRFRSRSHIAQANSFTRHYAGLSLRQTNITPQNAEHATSDIYHDARAWNILEAPTLGGHSTPTWCAHDNTALAANGSPVCGANGSHKRVVFTI